MPHSAILHVNFSSLPRPPPNVSTWCSIVVPLWRSQIIPNTLCSFSTGSYPSKLTIPTLFLVFTLGIVSDCPVLGLHNTDSSTLNLLPFTNRWPLIRTQTRPLTLADISLTGWSKEKLMWWSAATDNISSGLWGWGEERKKRLLPSQKANSSRGRAWDLVKRRSLKSERPSTKAQGLDTQREMAMDLRDSLEKMSIVRSIGSGSDESCWSVSTRLLLVLRSLRCRRRDFMVPWIASNSTSA